jgi:hypothetical protein
MAFQPFNSSINDSTRCSASRAESHHGKLGGDNWRIGVQSILLRSAFRALSSTPIRQSTPPNLPWCNFGKSAPFPDFCHDKMVLLQCSHGFLSRMTVDVRNLSADKEADCVFQSSSSQNMTACGRVPAWSFGKTCHREWLVLPLCLGTCQHATQMSSESALSESSPRREDHGLGFSSTFSHILTPVSAMS